MPHAHGTHDRGARRRRQRNRHRPRRGARGVPRALGFRRCARRSRRQSAAALAGGSTRERRCGRRRSRSQPRSRAARDRARSDRHGLGHAAARDARAWPAGSWTWRRCSLALAVAIVVGNTIRLEINNRSVEIEVTKLVGGTDGFIRRPFLYLGLCYGLAGRARRGARGRAGPCCCSALRSARWRPSTAVDSRCSGLSLRRDRLLLAGGALLGWAGAGLAAARHLRAIEPK